MNIEPPTIAFNSLWVRRKAILYDDHLSLQASWMLGIGHDLGQAYYDEIHYILRFPATDWPVAIWGILGAFVAFLGLMLQIVDESSVMLVGTILISAGVVSILWSVVRLIFFKRLVVRVVSARGSVEFRGDRPRSARRFVEALLQKVDILAAAPPPPSPPPAPEPPVDAVPPSAPPEH